LMKMDTIIAVLQYLFLKICRKSDWYLVSYCLTFSYCGIRNYGNCFSKALNLSSSQCKCLLSLDINLGSIIRRKKNGY
jgi:hypothetical protein